MNIIRSVIASLALMSVFAHADIENGSFESWNANTPENWTTIDAGISVVKSTSQAYQGSSSAQITVNTASQGATDFRQNVSVVSGQTYNVSVWIRHTEGSVRARLYVNGYRSYSNASLTNQWQELSYSYTASANGTIPIGLRFYDTSGFDGSEIVYVDNFQPNSDANNGGGQTPICSTVDLTLNIDNYGNETSWTIKDASNATIASGDSYASNSSNAESACLAQGNYTFTISDSYGDGICCNYGIGSYNLSLGSTTLASGGNFGSSESTSFVIGSGSGGGSGSGELSAYYADAQGLTGYALKTALYNIIKDHSTQSYSALWTFYNANERDTYYENDNSILDIYSEVASGNDAVTFSAGSNQCGNYSGEGDCYNREHSFPRSWFGGAVNPMNTDVHHIFATDGYVNAKRSSYPYGEVASASYTSSNGSKLGAGTNASGYTSTVFEPVDEFKGDIARAYFYMATRYENLIASWENNSSYSDAALNGTNTQVFEPWLLALLKSWHQQDPVSQKEIDRNEAAELHQGNRNPYVDYPSFVTEVWGN